MDALSPPGWSGWGGMRILICAKNDLAANIAVNRLLAGLGHAQVTLWLSNVDRPAELLDPDLATLRFFERRLPNDWLLPLVDRVDPDAQGDRLGYPALARRHRAPLEIIDDWRRPHWLARLEELAPDLIVSIRFSHIFPASMIAVPQFGVLNLHPGDLPLYAGLFAPFHQLLDGRDRLGCTLHWVDAGIDTGPIVTRRFLPVQPARSLIWHVCHVYLPGVDAAIEVCADLTRGRRPAGEIQDVACRHYHRLPDRKAFERFHLAGWKLVDYADYEGLLAGYRPAAKRASGAPSRAVGDTGEELCCRLPTA